jgi:HAD superfamily hydrolase (TIGR01509 family)
VSPKYTAVVFDMDGVLADSEPTYSAAMNVVLAPLGHRVSDELQRALMGHSVGATWDALRREFNLEGDVDALVERYDATLCEMLSQIHHTLPGVRELIEALREMRAPVALASSSWPGWIAALVDGVSLTGAFNAVVSAKEVAHGKPAPDVYLLAAERLGVDPAQCIAIEDTPTGLRSAKDAGMFAIQVRAASTAFPPLPEADLVLASLRDFDLGLLADAGPGV